METNLYSLEVLRNKIFMSLRICHRQNLSVKSPSNNSNNNSNPIMIIVSPRGIDQNSLTYLWLQNLTFGH